MSVSFKLYQMRSRRRWRKYWVAQDGRNHVEFYRTLAAEWRASR
jgi:hypothetical protein